MPDQTQRFQVQVSPFRALHQRAVNLSVCSDDSSKHDIVIPRAVAWLRLRHVLPRKRTCAVAYLAVGSAATMLLSAEFSILVHRGFCSYLTR